MSKSFLVILFIFSMFFGDAAMAQSSQKELGIRYLKLGNTYREAKDWTNAEKFIEKGLKLAGGDNYWKAVAYEYMGYTERDRAFSVTPVNSDALRSARNYLADAYDIYDRVITMRDGSPNALQNLKLEKDRIDDYLNGGSANSTDFGGTTLNYDGQKLKEMPDDISPGVVNLSMKDNRLKSLPYQLTTLSSLKYLNLSENKIKDLPGSVGRMRQLTWLDLSDNKLKDLPIEIAMLAKLEILDVSDNRLKELPSSLCTMKNLKVLDISGNKLEFERIKNIIQCLPNTNIIHDKYQREDDNGAGGLIFGQTGAPNAILPSATAPQPNQPTERKP